ncbi:MAG: hypothetical protein LBT97_03250 [Planctomycetota bacterium]|jgi:hypothetical protein|nr:hypothetical protein [Planctomycetota bacterium]
MFDLGKYIRRDVQLAIRASPTAYITYAGTQWVPVPANLRRPLNIDRARDFANELNPYSAAMARIERAVRDGAMEEVGRE